MFSTFLENKVVIFLLQETRWKTEQEKFIRSQFGKITVIKSLALSKLTHVFMTLPDPNDFFLDGLSKQFFVLSVFVFSIFVGRKKR